MLLFSTRYISTQCCYYFHFWKQNFCISAYILSYWAWQNSFDISINIGIRLAIGIGIRHRLFRILLKSMECKEEREGLNFTNDCTISIFSHSPFAIVTFWSSFHHIADVSRQSTIPPWENCGIHLHKAHERKNLFDQKLFGKCVSRSKTFSISRT